MDYTKKNKEKADKEELWQAHSLLWSNIYSFIKPTTLKCAIRLRIPEIIHSHSRPTTLHELMAAIPIPAAKADHLLRLMRLLTNSGIFASEGNGAYSLTPASRLLLPRPSGTSMVPFSLICLEPEILNVWSNLDEWYRIDEPLTPCEVAHGRNTWDFLQDRPRLQGLFNDALAADTEYLMDAVVSNCGHVFLGLRSLVDAGGGVGMAAKTIARAFPEIKVTVLDLPHVVAGLQEEDDDSGVKFVGGDIFKSISPADAIFLKSVLHDWTDEACVEILKNCKKAISLREAGGKVIILDMVIDPTCEDAMERETQLASDLAMLVSCMGKEREEQEWKKIIEAAGFSDYKFTPVLGCRYVIEIYP